MKRISIFCMLLVVLASVSGCNIPTPTPSSGTTPTIQAITPNATGSGTPGGVTPPPLPSFTPLTGSETPGVTPPPPPSITPIPPTQTPGGASPTPEPTYAVPMTETPTPGGGMPTPSGAINLDLLKNFTYEVVRPGLKITLKDGVYDGNQLHSRLIEPVAFGNLAGEGAPDAAVVLATNTGGSGTFYDLVAVIDNGGKPEEAAYTEIGDRQGIKDLQILAGRIVLDYLTQGPNDGLCCPSEHRLRTYILDGGMLRLVSEQVLSSPTMQATMVPNGIIIEQPAMGDQITGPVRVQGRVWFVPPDKKLAYRVTTQHGDQLMQGDVLLEGNPGGPGTFDFEINLGSVSPGIFKIEIVDVENGVLKGRSMVDLFTP